MKYKFYENLQIALDNAGESKEKNLLVDFNECGRTLLECIIIDDTRIIDLCIQDDLKVINRQ